MKRAAITKVRSYIKVVDVVIIGITSISLGIRMLIPPYIIFNSPHDDLLAVILARNIMSGDWLGEWNINTLAKPPGYSIFLTIAHGLYISPTTLTHILYLVFSLFFSYTIAQIASRRNLNRITCLRLVFAIMAFNPAIFGGSFSRVYRTSLYTVFVVLFFALLLKTLDSILVDFKKKSGAIKVNSKIRILVISMGLNYSILLNIRSESYWILFGLICSVIVFFAVLHFKRIDKKSLLKIYKLSFVFVILFALPNTLGNYLVGSINSKYYGTSISENYYSGNFAKAYKKWTGVLEGADPRSYVTISEAQRRAVYKVSPTAKTLELYLEIPPGEGWKIHGCNNLNLCNDYGPWLPWAIRDAAVASGQVTDEKSFQLFFSSIENEISTACSNGKLSCGNSGFSVGVKPLMELPVRHILNSAIESLSQILELTPAANTDRSITNTDPNLSKIWSDVVKYRYAPTSATSEWLSFPGVVRLLKVIYSPLIVFAFILSILFFFRKDLDEKTNSLKMFSGASVASLYLFILGLGVAEVSYGFSFFINTQIMAVQPLSLMILITCCVGFFSTFNHKRI
jgi:hypothetical protein